MPDKQTPGITLNKAHLCKRHRSYLFIFFSLQKLLVKNFSYQWNERVYSWFNCTQTRFLSGFEKLIEHYGFYFWYELNGFQRWLHVVISSTLCISFAARWQHAMLFKRNPAQDLFTQFLQSILKLNISLIFTKFFL